MIWFDNYSLDLLNEKNENCMVSHCDIKITKLEDDFVEGEMLVSDKVRQPFGIVHGGANCVLAETLGSMAANMVVNPKTHHAVGLSITTNHIKAVRNGKVRGVATPKHLGKTTHVWEINTYNDSNQLTSTTSLTMAIVSRLL